ncbi:hypothetical protein BKA69DRAFT_1041143 [Paraphysoderma sedebokerense]|nr:hypothetical protein BKA69DRAFT_1041143 [Paraphysoderma sedebokerense]
MDTKRCISAALFAFSLFLSPARGLELHTLLPSNSILGLDVPTPLANTSAKCQASWDAYTAGPQCDGDTGEPVQNGTVTTSWDQYITQSQNYLESICSPKCFNSKKSAIAKVKQACTARTEWMDRLMANIGIFNDKVHCLKGADGKYCEIKVYENLRDSGTTLSDWEKVGANISTVFISDIMFDGGDAMIDKLPKAYVCTECIKWTNEQAWAFTVHSISNDPDVNATIPKTKLQQLFHPVAKQLNEKCGPNFYNPDVTLDQSFLNDISEKKVEGNGAPSLKAMNTLGFAFAFMIGYSFIAVSWI